MRLFTTRTQSRTQTLVSMRSKKLEGSGYEIVYNSESISFPEPSNFLRRMLEEN